MANHRTIIQIYEQDVLAAGKRFPLYTWQDNGKQKLCELFRYIVIDKLHMTKQDLLQRFSLDFLQAHKIASATRRVYGPWIHSLVADSFPEWAIKPWEYDRVYVGKAYWTDDNVKSAVKWLIEEKLQWSLEKVNADISNSHFHEHGLGGMLRTLKKSGYELIATTYPDYDWTYLIERKGYKVTHAQVLEIRRLYHQEHIPQFKIAELFGLDRTTVHSIVHNKSFVK